VQKRGRWFKSFLIFGGLLALAGAPSPGDFSASAKDEPPSKKPNKANLAKPNAVLTPNKAATLKKPTAKQAVPLVKSARARRATATSAIINNRKQSQTRNSASIARIGLPNYRAALRSLYSARRSLARAQDHTHDQRLEAIAAINHSISHTRAAMAQLQGHHGVRK
jgi:hypothetical protein